MRKSIMQRGFSLVELSVVLSIVGIILAGSLDIATKKTESDRTTETNARMDVIEQALQIYLINNQRLPCPADATLASDSASFGIAGTATIAGCTGGNFNNLGTGGYVYSGAVPTKTLGIHDKYIADDWNRRFTYVVDYRFANNLTTNSLCDGGVAANHTLCFKQTSAGSITVNDATALVRTSEAIYVIISHGTNGNGAWKYVGNATRLSASTDTDETDNAGDDKSATFDATFVQKDATATFDDIARYKTKSLIIDGVSGVTDPTTCTSAFDADTLNVSSNTTDPCPNSSGSAQTNCYSLAAKINNLCLQP